MTDHEIPKELLFETDPGHGWLVVHKKTLAALGLTERDFSPYSYQSGDMRALEEDCDAGVFLERYKERTGHTPRFIEQFKDATSIRSWRSFGTKQYQDA